MTISQLRYVILLAEHGSFVAAAREANVTQPTLSMQVAKLEQDLGVLLFNRASKPLKPTSIGEKLIRHAHSIFIELDAINSIISEQEGLVRGTLRLGVIPTLAPYLLHRFLNQFTEQNKSLNLDVRELQTDEILQKLYSNELDAGLLATPLETRGLSTQALFYEPFYVYASDKHRFKKRKTIKSSELDANEMWTLAEGHCLRNQSLSICHSVQKATSTKTFLKAGSLETLLRLVEGGEGYTIVPALALEGLTGNSGAVVRPFSKPQPSREISLIYPSTGSNLHALEALASEIQSSLTGAPVSLDGAKLEILPT